MTTVVQSEASYCSFRLGADWYALEILCVREILRDTAVTPVPGAEGPIRGLINLRGQVVTIVEAASVLKRPADEGSSSSRLVILRSDADLEARGIRHLATSPDLVGLRVDEVGDVLRGEREALEPIPGELSSGVADAHLVGLLREGDRLVRVVEPVAFLPGKETP